MEENILRVAGKKMIMSRKEEEL
jgi:hypothetical protein